MVLSGQHGPTLAEQWRRFGEYGPVRCWFARAALVVTTAVIASVVLVLAGGLAVLLVRACIALFIAGWHATEW